MGHQRTNMLIKMLLVAGLVATAHTAPVGFMQDRLVPEDEFTETSSADVTEQTKKTCPAGATSCDLGGGETGCTGGACGTACVKGECVDMSNTVNTGTQVITFLQTKKTCPAGATSCDLGGGETGCTGGACC